MYKAGPGAAKLTEIPIDGAVSYVDVLIVGAGPAGLMMAAWLARCGVRTRIVDQKGTKVFTGQADGLQCRTLEIFYSFGIGDRVWKEANHLLEVCPWNPDSDGKIRRNARIPDTTPGISRFQQVVLHQGKIEDFFLDVLEGRSDIRVERCVLPTKLEFDVSLVESSDAYPITVHLRHLSKAESALQQTGTAVDDSTNREILSVGDTENLNQASVLNAHVDTVETVNAKYMLGADGAHSWVRQQLGFTLEGESTDYVWGVLDMVPITDFPDIRMRCAIHSADSGSIMVIPRENKIRAAQKIMAPYGITCGSLDWWTAYQIGQRVATQFSAHERIFLAGDAVHTHSPKAGQGMNVSMQDSYNLGWKVASVVKGLASRSILRTYESERRKIAQDLIAFDSRYSRLFSGRPARDIMNEEGISMDVFKDAVKKGRLFASGIAVDYCPSVIVAEETELDSVLSMPELAPDIKPGKRVPSVKILSQADARPWHLQERLPSDGRWRVLVFAGDVTNGQKSFLQRYKPTGSWYDSVIEVLTVHAGPPSLVDIFDFPDVFHPYDEIDGWDYDKIFVDDVSYHEGHGKLYETCKIDPEKGCLVLLRPDQHVSYVGPLEDYDAVDRFFSGFMVEQTA
ncbi:hypothetical protein BDW74DRAFT_186316 [Aspergillus multicolor]|uniref:putative FAD monooxygenase n=1 Tax=Aspergillus multicolor TaxID=41759 RepID=UPI003CCCB285